VDDLHIPQEAKMAVFHTEFKGRLVFEKDGTFVYLTEDDWYTAYVMLGNDAFMVSKLAVNLDQALHYADMIRRDTQRLGMYAPQRT